MAASANIPFVQTATAAACGAVDPDLGISLSTSCAAQQCSETGTASSVQLAETKIDDFNPCVFAVWQFTHLPVYNVAGNWTVRVNITEPADAGTWSQCHVLYINASTCVIQGSLGSVTGMTHNLSVAGVYTATVTTSALALTDSVRVYVVCIASGGSGVVRITPNQTISTTLLPGGPFEVRATQIYAPGSQASQVYSPGSQASQVYAPGSRASQICPQL